METTIDKAGRLVVPKRLRDRLGFHAGVRIEIVEEQGQLVLRPLGPTASVVERDGRPVLTLDREVEPLTAAQVRDLVERTRR